MGSHRGKIKRFNIFVISRTNKRAIFNSFEVECTRLKSSAYWLISMVCTSPPTTRVSSQLPTHRDFSNSLLVLEVFCTSEKHAPDGVSTDVNQASFWEMYTIFSTMGHKHMHQSPKHVYEYWLPLASCVTLSELTFLNLFFICKMGIIPSALQGSKEIKWWNPYNVTNWCLIPNRHSMDANFFPYPGWE